MRTTYTVLQMALALVEEPREHYGYELIERTGIKGGVAYPILQRMMAAGWLKPRLEQKASATSHNRPPRRYYRVTALGRREMTIMVARARDDLRWAAILT